MLYPINIDLSNRPVVVVGGGEVAARKTLRLVSAGAVVTVIAPQLDPSLAALAAAGTIRHLDRAYRQGDLDGALLAFAATNNPQVNETVAEEGKTARVLVDIVDAPEAGDFATPAVLERGDLLVTVSTSGASPALAKWIVEQLQRVIGEEYAETARLFRALREKLLTQKEGNAYNKRVFAELAAYDIPALIKNGQKDKIEQILLRLFGPGFSIDPDHAEKKDPS